ILRALQGRPLLSEDLQDLQKRGRLEERRFPPHHHRPRSAARHALQRRRIGHGLPRLHRQVSLPHPPGNYTVLEKLKSGKASNLYGTIYDAEGNVHNSNADAGDPVPEGGYFKGASMPYWMRLTWSGVGMHRGNVPRYPASHGCIRTYSAAVATVYSNVSIGTPVSIVK
ncbi:MAG: L,D-transpeptidase family protein, partial [Verrucomicrobia bacterium]|nr:L,D-transpeptidase family protein [Verrucomicrobiota bacterium]